jgi:hypothetical protein
MPPDDGRGNTDAEITMAAESIESIVFFAR